MRFLTIAGGKFTQKEIKEVDLVIERYKKSLEESPGLRKMF